MDDVPPENMPPADYIPEEDNQNNFDPEADKPPEESNNFDPEADKPPEATLGKESNKDLKSQDEK